MKFFINTLFFINASAALSAIIVIYFFGSPETAELFRTLLIIVFSTSILICILHFKKLTDWKKIYILTTLAIPAAYIGIWIILGLLMIDFS